MRISTGIDLDCPPDRAFSWIDDPEKAARWQTNVRDSEMITRTPERVGSTFRERVEEGGRGTEVVGTITQYVPGSLIAFELRSAFTTARVRYRVTPKGVGAHLDVDGDVRFRSALRLLRPLLGRALIRGIHRQLDDDLQRLRGLCEPGRSPS